jgi:hypothetical protein
MGSTLPSLLPSSSFCRSNMLMFVAVVLFCRILSMILVSSYTTYFKLPYFNSIHYHDARSKSRLLISKDPSIQDYTNSYSTFILMCSILHEVFNWFIFSERSKCELHVDVSSFASAVDDDDDDRNVMMFDSPHKQSPCRFFSSLKITNTHCTLLTMSLLFASKYLWLNWVTFLGFLPCLQDLYSSLKFKASILQQLCYSRICVSHVKEWMRASIIATSTGGHLFCWFMGFEDAV